jgi:hypothetical protein
MKAIAAGGRLDAPAFPRFRTYYSHGKFQEHKARCWRSLTISNRERTMGRVLGFTDAVGFLVLGYVVYKMAELGPYEAALLFGRTFRVFLFAVGGYA